jgi:hypothetical protein
MATWQEEMMRAQMPKTRTVGGRFLDRRLVGPQARDLASNQLTAIANQLGVDVGDIAPQGGMASGLFSDTVDDSARFQMPVGQVSLAQALQDAKSGYGGFSEGREGGRQSLLEQTGNIQDGSNLGFTEQELMQAGVPHWLRQTVARGINPSRPPVVQAPPEEIEQEQEIRTISIPGDRGPEGEILPQSTNLSRLLDSISEAGVTDGGMLLHPQGEGESSTAPPQGAGSVLDQYLSDIRSGKNRSSAKRSRGGGSALGSGNDGMIGTGGQMVMGPDGTIQFTSPTGQELSSTFTDPNLMTSTISGGDGLNTVGGGGGGGLNLSQLNDAFRRFFTNNENLFSPDITVQGPDLSGIINTQTEMGSDLSNLRGIYENLNIPNYQSNFEGIQDLLGPEGIGGSLSGLQDTLGTLGSPDGFIGQEFNTLGSQIGDQFGGLTSQIGGGFEGLNRQLGSGFIDIGDQLGSGFGGLRDQFDLLNSGLFGNPNDPSNLGAIYDIEQELGLLGDQFGGQFDTLQNFLGGEGIINRMREGLGLGANVGLGDVVGSAVGDAFSAMPQLTQDQIDQFYQKSMEQLTGDAIDVADVGIGNVQDAIRDSGDFNINTGGRGNQALYDQPILDMPEIYDYSEMMRAPLMDRLLGALDQASPFDTRRDQILSGPIDDVRKRYDDAREKLVNRFGVMGLDTPLLREQMRKISEAEEAQVGNITSQFGLQAAQADEGIRRNRLSDLNQFQGAEQQRVRQEMGDQANYQNQANQQGTQFMAQNQAGYMDPLTYQDTGLSMMGGPMGSMIQPNMGAASTGLANVANTAGQNIANNRQNIQGLSTSLYNAFNKPQAQVSQPLTPTPVAPPPNNLGGFDYVEPKNTQGGYFS